MLSPKPTNSGLPRTRQKQSGLAGKDILTETGPGTTGIFVIAQGLHLPAEPTALLPTWLETTRLNNSEPEFTTMLPQAGNQPTGGYLKIIKQPFACPFKQTWQKRGISQNLAEARPGKSVFFCEAGFRDAARNLPEPCLPRGTNQPGSILVCLCRNHGTCITRKQGRSAIHRHC